jgi:A/G-specific adenine glycosylase
MRGDFSVFRKALLTWFAGQKRDLPWRAQPSLYGTVVSEVMLQQTQVDTVLPYFSNWLERFPDFPSLAKAGEQEVLKEWEGLGYYSRARNLHKLAKSIVGEGIPEDVAGWLARPGVGPYTAAAIASIAQGIVEPVIDGNVIRVLARLERDEKPIRSAAECRKRFLPRAGELIDRENPGDFNEAMMELGAVICKKARPKCLSCPVKAHCEATHGGNPESVPVILRKAVKKCEVARLWVINEGCLLLHFNPDSATRLAGLAELPRIPAPPTGKPLMVRTRGISSEQVRESIFQRSPEDTEVRACLASAEIRWVPLEDLATISLSAPHRRWIEALLR